MSCDRLAPGVTAGEIVRLMREGDLPSDRVFDEHLPADLRRISSVHWTPLIVAVRAAQWLRAFGARTVVDIGSGVGKFCIAVALAGDCSFIGLERRPRLVAVARRLARTFQIQDRARFCVATVGEDQIPIADAYYLFNPFAESLFGPEAHIDPDIDVSESRHARDVSTACRLLHDAPAGTFVITYHGFGGRVPPGYEVVCVDRALPGVLRMWRKVPG